jgi:hypothetical protein
LIGRDGACIADEHVLLLEIEQARRAVLGPFSPRFEAIRRPNIGGQCFIVECEDRLFVDEQVAPPRAIGERLDGRHHALVVPQKRRVRAELSLYERVANEDLARGLGVDAREVDAPLGDDGEAVQHDLLEADHLPARLVPMGLEVALFDEVLGERLHPLGLDLGDRARVETPRLHDLRRHDERRSLLEKDRAGKDVQLEVARADVEPIVELHPDVAEVAGEERLVERGVVAASAQDRKAHLSHQLMQLPVHVLPFAHAQERDEVLLAPRTQLARRGAARLLLIGVPELQIGDEIGVVGLELAVRLVRLFLGLVRAEARILDRQRRGDDEDLGEAAVIAPPQDDASDPRIDGEPRELLADARELVLLVDGTELEERRRAVADGARARGLDERKLFDVAEAERRHL